MFFRGAKAAIVCFDLTMQGSFEDAKQWMSEVKSTEPVSIFFSPSRPKSEFVEKNYELILLLF